MEERDRYLLEFGKLEKGSVRNEPAWVRGIRKAAIDRFAEAGFPSTRDEEWKYTNVSPIAMTPFKMLAGPEPDGLTVERLSRITFGELECTHLVFLNGHYSAELSRLRPLPEGAKVGSLAGILRTDAESLEPHLARYVDLKQNAFAALNTAFLRDGAFVYLPEGVVLEEPIHLLFVATSPGEAIVSHPRNLIVAGRGSQAAIVESYVALGDAVYFTNAVTEIVGGENAVIDHCWLQRESVQAFHVATLQAYLGRNCNFSSHSISLGGALVRNDVNVVLDGEGVNCSLNGLYLTTGRQHVDNHTLIDHAKPHCSSREIYKGVLDGKSRGVFNGKIFVRKDAQKTDAKQTNKNLLLSEEALIDTKPQLEIYADDVKCTHGATIGQLDEDALFYLCSRGIDRATARSLLIHAFGSEILHRMPVGPVRTGLECLLFTRMHDGHPIQGRL